MLDSAGSRSASKTGCRCFGKAESTTKVGIQLGCNQLLLDFLDDNRMPPIRLQDTPLLLSALFTTESRLVPHFVITQPPNDLLASFSIRLLLVEVEIPYRCSPKKIVNGCRAKTLRVSSEIEQIVCTFDIQRLRQAHVLRRESEEFSGNKRRHRDRDSKGLD